eukprot:3238574-Lingulodinium_polyedra.AAC.1
MEDTAEVLAEGAELLEEGLQERGLKRSESETVALTSSVQLSNKVSAKLGARGIPIAIGSGVKDLGVDAAPPGCRRVK